MKKCSCGNSKFYATQKYEVAVIVTGELDHIDEKYNSIEDSIVDLECPDGPFECTECGRVYESLSSLEEDEDDEIEEVPY